MVFYLTKTDKCGIIEQKLQQFNEWLKTQDIAVYEDLPEDFQDYIDNGNFSDTKMESTLVLYSSIGYNQYIKDNKFIVCNESWAFGGHYFKSEKYNNEWEIFDDFIEYIKELNSENEDDDENSN